jgi:hypothetical protein
LAADLISRKVDVIAASGGDLAAFAHQRGRTGRDRQCARFRA